VVACVYCSGRADQCGGERVCVDEWEEIRDRGACAAVGKFSRGIIFVQITSAW
jgi:hypothetical protein